MNLGRTSISRSLAVQEGEKSWAGRPVTEEGGRHRFTNYFHHRQELTERYEKGVISKTYVFDFKRIA